VAKKTIGPTRDPLTVRAFPTPGAFEAWLARHHETAPGVWLKFAKKSSGVASVTYAEALEIALCHGWIDGQVQRLDERFYLQRFTPRARRSKWSKINCAKADALIAAGRMKPAGLRQVEAARSDGRWGFAYDSPRTATAHPDLLAVLLKNRAAEKFFAALDRRNRYAIFYAVREAKKPETSARRIARYVKMLARGKKPHP